MSKKILVSSMAHTALTLMEPNPNPEKPGDSPPLRSVTINSSGQPGRAALTTLEGEDAEVFSNWAKANKNSDLLRSGVLSDGEESDGEESDGEEKWGHETFLPEAEGSGSTVKEKAGKVKEKAGKVKASQMTEKGPGKPDDGPGEPRHASQPGGAEPDKGAGASGAGEAPAVNPGKDAGKK